MTASMCLPNEALSGTEAQYPEAIDIQAPVLCIRLSLPPCYTSCVTRVGGDPMLMAEETFLACILFSIPVIWMFLKMAVNHLDQQPHQPTPGPALSSNQKQPFDKAA